MLILARFAYGVICDCFIRAISLVPSHLRQPPKPSVPGILPHFLYLRSFHLSSDNDAADMQDHKSSAIILIYASYVDYITSLLF
jgi:hypothetical protein